ncbi:MAG: GFA family protein [Kiloniellales bacterium]
MLTGGCQCGALRYESAGAPLALYACHCRECQKQSASAFGLSLEVPYAGLRLTRGAPKTWRRNTDSGRRLVCVFCPDCGSRIWHESEAEPKTVTIKAGSLDEPVDLGAAIHIWTSRKLPGVVIPEGAKQFPEEPE